MGELAAIFAATSDVSLARTERRTCHVGETNQPIRKNGRNQRRGDHSYPRSRAASAAASAHGEHHEQRPVGRNDTSRVHDDGRIIADVDLGIDAEMTPMDETINSTTGPTGSSLPSGTITTGPAAATSATTSRARGHDDDEASIHRPHRW